ncbi:hypothetical protein [Hymenobacter guriensis]|uniref:Lipoprotein n=1 Tax=Hymenobacter guriensis TaxID=2793065 RepID=A0ABS0KYL2_9BACT|nr:hypothetical protein [Hymenobacter guriensis]MBG8552825.1 hypothetical protein [Hymenobacter guriensis]
MHLKYILTASVISMLVACSSSNQLRKTYTMQADNYTVTYLKKGKVEGVFFSKEYLVIIDDSLQRGFTPVIGDIEEAEQILSQNLKKAYVRTHTIYDCGPNIYHNLKKYRRQYFGYTDKRGNKIILTICYWPRRNINDFVDQVFYREPADTAWKKNAQGFIIGGCGYYWEAKIDITRKILFDLRVSGRDIASL